MNKDYMGLMDAVFRVVAATLHEEYTDPAARLRGVSRVFAHRVLTNESRAACFLQYEKMSKWNQKL